MTLGVVDMAFDYDACDEGKKKETHGSEEEGDEGYGDIETNEERSEQCVKKKNQNRVD